MRWVLLLCGVLLVYDMLLIVLMFIDLARLLTGLLGGN